jgi:voltage-gated potassium channel
MKKINWSSSTLWNTILLIAVIFAAFVLPILPVGWNKSFFRAVFTVIYISAILSLERRSNYLLILFISTLLLEWLSGVFNLQMQVLLSISKGFQIIFFIVIVVSLIRQIATARNVSAKVILDSFVGYLLIGLIYSIFVAFIMQQDPGAFSNQKTDETQNEESLSRSVPLYFSFVTQASLGYGDIVPLKPYTRSLATLITITGQFYIAIIVALLVGKFSSRQNTT